MIRKVLVPVTFEFIPAKALFRAGSLGARLNVPIHVVFVDEGACMTPVDAAASHAISVQERADIEKALTDACEREAREVILKRCVQLLNLWKKDLDISTSFRSGKLYKEVNSACRNRKANLIIMEHRPAWLKKYRIFQMAKYPLWIDQGRDVSSVLGVLTNLAPNKKVPNFAIETAKAYDVPLELLFVVDSVEGAETTVSPGEAGVLLRELEAGARKKGLNVTTTVMEGPIVSKVNQRVKATSPGLVILGRIRSQIGFLGLFERHIKSTIAKKARHNVVVIN